MEVEVAVIVVQTLGAYISLCIVGACLAKYPVGDAVLPRAVTTPLSPPTLAVAPVKWHTQPQQKTQSPQTNYQPTSQSPYRSFGPLVASPRPSSCQRSK